MNKTPNIDTQTLMNKTTNMMTTANLPASASGLTPRVLAALTTLDWRPLVSDDGEPSLSVLVAGE